MMPHVKIVLTVTGVPTVQIDAKSIAIKEYVTNLQEHAKAVYLATGEATVIVIVRKIAGVAVIRLLDCV